MWFADFENCTIAEKEFDPDERYPSWRYCETRRDAAGVLRTHMHARLELAHKALAVAQANFAKALAIQEEEDA